MSGSLSGTLLLIYNNRLSLSECMNYWTACGRTDAGDLVCSKPHYAGIEGAVEECVAMLQVDGKGKTSTLVTAE